MAETDAGQLPDSEGLPPSDDGRSCVCEGVVIEAEVRPDMDEADAVGHAQATSDLPIGPFSSAGSAAAGWAHIPPAACGRSTRLAICSLLL